MGVGVSILDRYSAASSSQHCPLSVMNVIGPATTSALFCSWVAKFVVLGSVVLLAGDHIITGTEVMLTHGLIDPSHSQA